MYVNKYRFDKSNSISTISHRHKRGLYLGLGGILRLDFLAKKEELVVKRGEILVAVQDSCPVFVVASAVA